MKGMEQNRKDAEDRESEIEDNLSMAIKAHEELTQAHQSLTERAEILEECLEAAERISKTLRPLLREIVNELDSCQSRVEMANVLMSVLKSASQEK